ncbi:hypothetical protein [Stenotrophomonas rhizophila]
MFEVAFVWLQQGISTQPNVGDAMPPGRFSRLSMLFALSALWMKRRQLLVARHRHDVAVDVGNFKTDMNHKSDITTWADVANLQLCLLSNEQFCDIEAVRNEGAPIFIKWKSA